MCTWTIEQNKPYSGPRQNFSGIKELNSYKIYFLAKLQLIKK